MIRKSLILKIKKGSEYAFRELYDLYFYKVANYAYKMLHSKEDATEVAQDVFVRLWNKREQLDTEQSVEGLVFRITKFIAIDRLRKQQHLPQTFGISSAIDMSERSLENKFLDEELFNIYEQVLGRLPEKRRRIFQLSRDEHLSYKEIALRLNISIKTVEAQIRLALQQIREDLGAYTNKITILAFLIALL